MADSKPLIRFQCPHCEASIKCDQRHAGRNANCPKCNASLLVPDPSAEPVEEEPPPMLEIQPFDLKGDVLGMKLSDFKRKHHRVVTDDETAPWCSDRPLPSGAVGPRPAQPARLGQPAMPAIPAPGAGNSSLLTEDYYAEVGLVNCRLDFPFEQRSAPPPTVAGVQTQLLVYEFVDERLFRIRVTFGNDGFDTVLDAFTSKYGTPIEQAEFFVWANEVSTIVLKKGRLKRDSSILIFAHTELCEVADSRRPGPSVQDI